MGTSYQADERRYENGMQYNRCGRSGVLLPKVSLGFWHNFGSVDPFDRSRELVRYALDHGITQRIKGTCPCDSCFYFVKRYRKARR